MAKRCQHRTFLMLEDMVDVMSTRTRLLEGHNLVELKVNIFLTITIKLLALRLLITLTQTSHWVLSMC